MSAALLLLALAAHGLADRRMTSPVGARQSTDVAGLPGVGCVCVPYYQCEDSPNVNRGDIDIIDIRDNDDRCSHYLDVCCKSLKMRPSPGGSQPSTEFPHPTPPPSQQPCGQRSPGGVGFRITGGDSGEAQFGEFPWMVAILEQRRVAGIDRPINAYLCGGALILAQVVITAAHCIAGKDPAQLWVRAGEWDTQTTKELYPHQDRKGAQVIAHPRYRPRTLHNDVALLVMLDPVRLGGHVGLVCLPPQGQPFDRSRCTASGWGKDKFGG